VVRQLDKVEGDRASQSSGKIHCVGGPGINGLGRTESSKSLPPFPVFQPSVLISKHVRDVHIRGVRHLFGAIQKTHTLCKVSLEKYGMQTQAGYHLPQNQHHLLHT